MLSAAAVLSAASRPWPHAARGPCTVPCPPTVMVPVQLHHHLLCARYARRRLHLGLLPGTRVTGPVHALWLPAPCRSPATAPCCSTPSSPNSTRTPNRPPPQISRERLKQQSAGADTRLMGVRARLPTACSERLPEMGDFVIRCNVVRPLAGMQIFCENHDNDRFLTVRWAPPALGQPAAHALPGQGQAMHPAWLAVSTPAPAWPPVHAGTTCLPTAMRWPM